MENTLIELTPLAPLDSMHAGNVSDDANTYIPEGVCAKMIRFAVEDHKLVHLSFTGGCEGNLKAMSILLKGMDVSEVIEKLSGITCGKKPTSCADQLCRALTEHMAHTA